MVSSFATLSPPLGTRNIFSNSERLKQTSMDTYSYQKLDETCRQAKKHLSQLLLDRRDAVSQVTREGLHSDAIKVYHFWAEKLCAAVIDYAFAANPPIVARVFNLPRELRDTVYMYLWEPDDISDPTRDLLYWWEHFDEPWMLQGVDLCNSPCSANMTDLRPPHFVDQAFVNEKFAGEVLKRFKDMVGKDLRPLVNHKNPVAEFHVLDASIEAFVKKDMFGVGKTMEELVRNLDLRIDFQCDVLENDDSLESESPAIDTGIERRKYLAELDEAIAALLSIPYTERIVIRNEDSKGIRIRPRIVKLVMRQECVMDIENTLVPILKLVFQASNGLKEKGFNVKIQYHSDEIGLKVIFEEDVWTWTDKDWRMNLKDKNVSKVEAEERDLEKVAEVWEYLRRDLFHAEHAEL